MAKRKHSKSLISELTKLQRNLRDATALVPWNDPGRLTPVEPHGPEADRFRVPEQALLNWTSKRTQRWSFQSHVKTESGRTLAIELAFELSRNEKEKFGPIPLRWVRAETLSARLSIADPMNADPEKVFRSWTKGGILGKSGYAAAEKIHIEIDGWYAWRNPTGTLSIFGSGAGNSVSLHLTPAKPLAYLAQNGFLQTGPRSDDSSYSCAFTSMNTRGTILLDGILHDVTGSTWLDHEKRTDFASKILQSSRKEDRMLIRLPTNEELLLNVLRDAGPRPGSFSCGSFIDRDGHVVHLISSDIVVEPQKWWKSRLTGARYPLRSRIRIEPLSMDLEVRPLTEDAECGDWSGPVLARVIRSGEPVNAEGHVRFRGYDTDAGLVRKIGSIIKRNIIEKP